MAGLKVKLTQTGLKALFDADKNQIKIKIAKIGFGDKAYTPTGFETSLKNEIIRVPILSGRVRPELGEIDFSTIIPKDTPNFWIREIGFYDEKDRLIFIWSDPDVIIGQKTKFITMLEGIRIKITQADISNIQIIEAQPDVKLLYFEEWLSTSKAIINLSNSILKLLNNQFELQKQVEENTKSIKEEKTKLNKLTADYYTFKPNTKDMLLALALQNVILSKKLIKLELKNLQEV